MFAIIENKAIKALSAMPIKGGVSVKADDPRLAAFHRPQFVQHLQTACSQAADMVVNGAAQMREMQLVAEQAQTYAAAGYSGATPTAVTSLKAAQGITAKAAADQIIAETTARDARLLAIRDARLKGVAAIKSAATMADMQAALDAALATLAAI